MALPPPEKRPTARELASGGEQPLQIAGKPADICPYCGCAMFADGTRNGEAVIFRYVACRNQTCGKRFMSKQPVARLVREIGTDDVSSSSGQNDLGIYVEAC
jgi:hypothetical protein